MLKKVFTVIIILPVVILLVHLLVIKEKPVKLVTPSPTANPVKATVKPKVVINPTEDLTNDQKFVMTEINKYRVSKGLKEVTAEVSVCELAQQRADEFNQLITNDPYFLSKPEATSAGHQGFWNRVNNNTLPHGGNWTENLAGYLSISRVVSSWIASPTHEENLVDDTPYVCVKNSGSAWAMIGWKPTE
jgi:uncharacterized protein YkwD